MEEYEEAGILGSELLFLLFMSEFLFIKGPTEVLYCTVSGYVSMAVFFKKLIRMFRARLISQESLLVICQTVIATVMILTLFAECHATSGGNVYIILQLVFVIINFALLLGLAKTKFLSRNDHLRYIMEVDSCYMEPTVRSSEEWINMLMQIIKCTVCRETLSPMAAVCEKGHAVCLECVRGCCPECRKPFKPAGCNMVLHQILAFAESTFCKYCFTIMKPNHDAECSERSDRCQVCAWAGPHRALADHMKTSHPTVPVKQKTKKNK